MYPQTPVARKFKYQPIINFTQTNAVLRNQTQMNIGIPPAVPKCPMVRDKQVASFLKRNNKIKNLPRTRKIDVITNKPSIHPLEPLSSNQDSMVFRRSSFESIPSQRSVPIPSSYSVNNIHDRIMRERKAHTMAPFARILGPSTSPKAKLFASIVAPVDTHTTKTNHVSPEICINSSMTLVKSEVDVTDDDATVIIRVQYDPEVGAPPSEDTVRQAVNNQLLQRTDKKIKNEPIVVNFLKQNTQAHFPIRPQQPVFNRPLLPFQHRTSLRIPLLPQYQQQPPAQQIKRQNVNSVLRPPVQQSPAIPLTSPVRGPSVPKPQNTNNRLVQPSAPLIKPQQKFHPEGLLRFPTQNIKPLRATETYPTGINILKSLNTRMATEQVSITRNDQQNASQRLQVGNVSNEVFRPSAVTEVPELSKENLLNMLNQIPDLQGRQFNIEYAQSGAPEGYPIPLNIATAANTYPEPVVIDQLPNNVIQHVQRSNNPALTAALEATIRLEQLGPSTDRSQATIPTLNVPMPTIMHHTAQQHEQVQQSPPASSSESDSSTEVSSSGTSSSSSSTEESENEEMKSVPLDRSMNNPSFVGSASTISSAQKQCR